MLKPKSAALLAAGAAAAAVAYAGIHRLISKMLVGVALDREKPRLMKKLMPILSGFSFDRDHVEHVGKLGEEIIAMPHEDVEIESFDGLPLKGHLYRAENEKRILIAMHGWRSGWVYDFGAVWDFWQAEDATILCPEQRGQGESGGDYMGFGMVERHDCLKWAEWASENLSSDVPIYLVGLSMGASTVLMTAGFENLPENVRGVIADCGFTSPEAVWEHVMCDNLKIPYKTRKKTVDALCRARIGVAADEYSTLDAMKTNKLPILFIHGTDDHFVPARMSEENYEACKAPKELLLVEGADHAQSYIRDKERYEAAVREFFIKYDR